MDQRHNPIILEKGVKTLNAFHRDVWEDLRVPLTSTRAAANSPGFAQLRDNGAGSVGVFASMFDKSSDEQLFFSAQIPHSYKENSDIKVHAHWCPTDTDTGTVLWGLEYTWANVDGVLPVTTLLVGTPQAASGTAFNHQLAEIGTISGTSKDISSMLVCRIYRDVSGDDYDNDAALLEIDFHFRKNTLGSLQESSKY